MKKITVAILNIITLAPVAQADSIPLNVSFSGYSEVYYSYDFSNPDNHYKPWFLYSHNKHNEVNLNLGYIKAAFDSENARATVAFMAGTYSNANLAAEPGVLRNIYEAYTGVKISKKKNLWIDAGVFSSHIGFESAHAPGCWTLTRSIPAENSPYYESGAKLSYTSNNKRWLLSGLILNGWQRIQRINGNNTPAFGHQLTFKANSNITLNSSSFIGNDKPDSIKQMRYFHDFYGVLQLTPNFGATIGFDIGGEEKEKNSSGYNIWYSPVLILKATIMEKFSIAVRGEYYSDPNGVIITAGTALGFQIFGYSLNLDYTIRENILWRIEGRSLYSKDKIFWPDSNPSDQNHFVTTSLAITF